MPASAVVSSPNHRMTAFERVTHNSVRPIAQRTQSLHRYPLEAPPFDTEAMSKGRGMHYGSLSKTLGERVSAALTRRLFPNTNLTRKQLQSAIGISVGTMDNLLSGHHDPSGRVLDKLVAFFKDSFINEIWGAHNIHCIDTRMVEKALVVAQLVAAQAELRRLG